MIILNGSQSLHCSIIMAFYNCSIARNSSKVHAFIPNQCCHDREAINLQQIFKTNCVYEAINDVVLTQKLHTHTHTVSWLYGHQSIERKYQFSLLLPHCTINWINAIKLYSAECLLMQFIFIFSNNKSINYFWFLLIFVCIKTPHWCNQQASSS